MSFSGNGFIGILISAAILLGRASQAALEEGDTPGTRHSQNAVKSRSSIAMAARYGFPACESMGERPVGDVDIEKTPIGGICHREELSGRSTPMDGFHSTRLCGEDGESFEEEGRNRMENPPRTRRFGSLGIPRPPRDKNAYGSEVDIPRDVCSPLGEGLFREVYAAQY